MPLDGSDPAENYRTIRKELELHSAALAAKPEILAGSKLDVSGAYQAAGKLARDLDRPVLAFSAVAGENLRELVNAVWKLVRAEREKAAVASTPPPPRRIPPHRRMARRN